MTTFQMFAFVFGAAGLTAAAMLIVSWYYNRKQASAPAPVDDEDNVSWYMLSPDSRTVECVYCPTTWPLYSDEAHLFATLRQHGREHAG